MWLEQMAKRCPSARACGTGRLDGFQWIISSRGYANVLVSPSDYVLGTVFELGAADESALDGFEGMSTGSYVKEFHDVGSNDARTRRLLYVDPRTCEGVARPEYRDRIRAGCRDARLPAEYAQRYLLRFIAH